MKGLYIRREGDSAIEAIRKVHDVSFDSPLEAELVDTLQVEGDAVISLVAWLDGEVCGHVMFSRMRALEYRGLRVTALGPLAVLPEHRNLGIGTRLVREGLHMLRDDGEDLVIVLGAPDFYARFGFTAEAAQPFQTPYDGPNLQALPLSDAGSTAGGVLRYARAFSALV